MAKSDRHLSHILQQIRMDEELYDQFGNYIGPEVDSSEGEEPEVVNEEPAAQVVQGSNEHRIVLHEDKKYYQDHEEMYPEAEIMIEQEDRQNIDTPIVNKEEQKFYDFYETLPTVYDSAYLQNLLPNSALVRNICVAGHLAHGKTLFLDMLIQQTHIRKWNLDKNYRWMDSRFDEQERQMTVKTKPISLLLPDQNSKSYILSMIDTPGHPNFHGELVAGLRMADGVLLVVDAIEGLMMGTETIIKHILREDLDVVVVINKIDRLIIEMKIPPEDAYLKICHTLEEINGVFQKSAATLGVTNRYVLSPAANNVVFASAEYGFMLTVESMCRKYQKKFQHIDCKALERIMWGDYYFNRETGKFTRKGGAYKKRTFVEFILEPIQKIFSHTVGKDRDTLEVFLAKNLEVQLSPQEYRLNIKSMVKLIFMRYFENSASLVSSLISNIRTPSLRAKTIIQKLYRGPSSTFRDQALKGSSDGPLLINVVKLYHKSDYKTFDALGRVISGTLKKKDRIRILGENYDMGDEEDMFVRQAQKLYLLQGRYRIEVDQATAGSLVLIEGIDQSMSKTSTIIHASVDYKDIDIMLPLKYWTQSIIKVSIEPLVPSQLPKMIEGIRRANKSYLMLKTKVEESGQHVIVGTGEMHLESILHDIRNLYSDIEVRISDPCVELCETVVETSGIPCYADTPNKKNQIKALAGPLERGIADQVQRELLDVHDRLSVKRFVEEKFDWDELASSNIWQFGPEAFGTNVLINDTLVSNTSQNDLERIRPSLIQGFKWSTREGPLCDEPMRNVKFRVIDATISSNPAEISPGQMIPTARRAFYSAFLTGNPRLMEPVYLTEIQCTTSESIEAVFNVLAKRRGTIQSESPKSGTPHYIIKATLPCIETLGFETDLRAHTVGQAFCLSILDHWQIVPGDPLEKITLKPLEVMDTTELARQFMVKTRRRKGLNEQVSIVKYFDDQNIKEMLKNDLSFQKFI